MKKRLLSIILSLGLLSVAGCNSTAPTTTSAGNNSTPPTTTSANNNPPTTETEDKFTEKEVNVYYNNSSQNQKAKLRFYENKFDIPYIGIKEYYNILVKDTPLKAQGELKIEKKNNTYKIETPRKGVAVVDTELNTFYSDNLVQFNSTNYNDFTLNGLFLLDGAPWLKIKTVSYNRKPTPFMVDFDDYKIDIFSGDNDVYFPFNTVSDLFLNENLLNASYNQKDIYVLNGSLGDDISKFEGYGKPILEKQLSKAYSEYNYYELCFLYDNLLGRPNRTAIERNYNLENGLDYALSNDELGSEIKNMLTSSDVADYFAATRLLHALFTDGGHTNFMQLNSYLSSLSIEDSAAFQTSDIAKKINSKLSKYTNVTYKVLGDQEIINVDHLNLRSSREKMLGLTLDSGNITKTLLGTNSYHKVNNTAIISIDDFMGDFRNIDAWNEYYEGKRDDIPYNENMGGCVASIYKGLLKAKEDGVQNVIVDLASNTGGSVDELIYLIGILTNQKEFSHYNYLTGQITVATFDIDINLDGKFDELDNTNMVEDFNLAVLCSKNGFSCGGISPIYLHDANIFTMGDVSGGGSCSILYIYDAYGLKHIASSPVQMYTLNGASIDSVRSYSCDLPIELKDGNPLNKYDNFYDINKLEEYILNHYAL